MKELVFQKRQTQRTCFAALLFAFSFITGCGEAPNKAPEVSFIPCPAPVAAPGTAAGAGDARHLFFKIFCNIEPGQPANQPLSINKLWGIDPANPTEEFQIEPNFLGGSLSSVMDGTWNESGWNALGKVPNQKTRFMIYMKEDGRFYKVSALKADGLVPSQLSNEQLPRTPLPSQKISLSEPDEVAFCGGYSLAHYLDIHQSSYLYTHPGPDGKCTTWDDNLQKILRLNMGPSDSPIVLPYDNSDLMDYEFPLAPGVVPGSAIENKLAIKTDLIDKKTGGVAGWLMMKTRYATHPVQHPFHVRNTQRDILEVDAPYGHGLAEGTPVRVGVKAGVPLPIGIYFDKIYYVHVTSYRTFKLYRPHKRIAVVQRNDGSFYKLIEVVGGKRSTSDGSGHAHPQTEECIGEPLAACKPEAPEPENDPYSPQNTYISFNSTTTSMTWTEPPTRYNEPHQDIYIEDIISNGGGIVQQVVPISGLYRYDTELTFPGTKLKETEFLNICTVSGHDQTAGQEQEVPSNFLIRVTNQNGLPVSGIPVSWTAHSKTRQDCHFNFFNPFGGFESCSTVGAEIVSVSNSGMTNGNGEVAAKGKTGVGEGPHKSLFIASIGDGAKVAFAVGTEHLYWENTSQIKRTPPSCGTRMDSVIAGILPMGYGNPFTGKMFIRFDLSFRPHPTAADGDKPTKEDREKAKKIGTKGALHLYDVAANILSPVAQYISAVPYQDGDVASFPDGFPYIADERAVYFFDKSNTYVIPNGDSPIQHRTLVRLPFEGGGATVLSTEVGRQKFSQLHLTTYNVVYNTIDQSVAGGADTILKSVNKTGGGAVRLLNTTKDSLGNVMTSGPFVYFQTQGKSPIVPFDPNNPGKINVGALSQIISIREDGANLQLTKKATYIGRTDSRILAITNCQEFTFSCAQGTLLSFDSLNPMIVPITLGTLPLRNCGGKHLHTTDLSFEGMGSHQVLLEGGTSCDETGDEPGDGSGASKDMFYVQEDQSNSLATITTTPNVPETLP
ncbi:MAG: hypothetical protein AAB035_03560 [Nitrospirota bacterium]